LQAKLIQKAVFGTVTGDQASPSSDVDLLNRRRPLGVADCYDFT
jgi:predicted nucleotidyltransferase